MEDAGIYAREFATLDRVVQVGIASGQVIDVSFPDRLPDDAATEHPLLERLSAYLDGAEDGFQDVERAITVPTAQRDVLDAVCQIPYGETGTARQVARMADLDPGDDEDARTVRTALRANPVPVLVPDHRVEDAPGATPAEVAASLRRIEQ